MSQLYETRLKKEFELLQKLDRHPDVKDVISIQYQERIGNKSYISIQETPKGLYPNSFMVTYTMPMYVAAGKIKKDWSASFAFDVPESVLMNPMSNLGVRIVGNNGNFKQGEVPFNNHCSTGWVCTGSAWGVANQGFGIWYFVLALGCLLNQEEFMMANERHHLNSEAFEYWDKIRRRKPNNDIKWPFRLNTEFSFGTVEQAQKPSFTFGPIQQPKPTFTFGPKITA